MTLSSIQIRQRIAGGFRTAQVSKEEKKFFDARTKRTLSAREAIGEMMHEFADRMEDDLPDTMEFLIEKIGMLMQLGEDARLRRIDYQNMSKKHEALNASYHAELQKKGLRTSLRQDIADAHEQHSGLLADLERAISADSATYEETQKILNRLEPRLMVFYPTPSFPVFHFLDNYLRDQATEEAYEEGEITLEEALSGEADDFVWQPTRH